MSIQRHYLQVTGEEEPNIAVMQYNGTELYLDLLKIILEEHFDVECKICEVKANKFDKFKFDCTVIVDTERHNKPTHEIWLERAFVYNFDYIPK